MNTNFGTIIDREGWEARIVDPFSPSISIFRDEWNSPNRKNTPAERRLVMWDKITDTYVSLPAIGALEILQDMREVETWKTDGIVIGVAALTSAPKEERTIEEEILQTPFFRRWPEYVLSDPLRLDTEQSKDLFGFLLENERLLTELAEKDESIARRQLTDMFKKIAEYGRQVRQRRSDKSRKASTG